MHTADVEGAWPGLRDVEVSSGSDTTSFDCNDRSGLVGGGPAMISALVWPFGTLKSLPRTSLSWNGSSLPMRRSAMS